MSYLDVHWKGRPHYHVPRIRVASRRSFRSRSLLHSTDDQAVRKLFNIPISKKLEFRIRFRRRKTRSSRSASSRAWDRRRALSKAKQNIQIYGWDSAAAEVASIVTRPRADCYSSVRARTRRKTSIANQLSPRTTNTTAGPLTGGAASSTLYNTGLIGTKNLKNRPTSRSSKPVKLSPPCCAHKQQRQTARSTVSLSPPKTTTPKSADVCSNLSELVSVYDAKTDLDRRSASTIKREQKCNSIVGRRSSRESRKGQITASTNLGEASDLAAEQVNGCGCSDLETATVCSVLTSLVSDKASRTSSERRTLEKFSQELKRYLQVAEAFPKPKSASSRAATIISANTVAALRPYWNEFQSAGLAVTSNEQRGMALKESSKSRKVSIPPSTNLEESEGDSRFPRGTSRIECSIDRGRLLLTKGSAEPSRMSDSTGTTVIGFTPPREKTYGSSKMPVPRRGLSSDHTIMGFNPSRGTDMQAVSPTSRPSAKKSLPWLRKQTPQSNEKLDRRWSSQKTTLKDDLLRDMILPLSPQEPLPLDEIIRFSSRKGTRIKNETSGGSRLSHFLSDARSRDSDVTGSTAEVAQIPKSINLRGIRYHYSDMGTQTLCSNDIKVMSSDTEQKIVARRAPLPNCPNKTLPLVDVKCLEVCCAGTRQTLPVGHIPKPRLSKVHWKGAHGTAQIAEVEPWTVSESQVKEPTPATLPQTELGEHDQHSVNSQISDTGPSRPLTATTTRNPEGEASTTGKNAWSQRTQYTNYSPEPSAQRYPVPRCTQCDRDSERITTGPNPELPFESEYGICLVAREYPAHRCRARSSIQCQQCLPSRRESATASPLEISIPSFQPKSAVLNLASDVSARNEIALDSPSIVAATRGGDTKHASLGSGQRPLIPEPVKRPILPMLNTLHGPKPRPQPHLKSVLDSVSLLYAKALPQIPQPPIDPTNSLPLESQISSAALLDTCRCPRASSSQKLALRGLRVATAAACDEDVNKWVQETTGLAVRQFLADLGRFEHLSDDNSPISTARNQGQNITN